MHPILFELGGVLVRSQAVVAALGVVLAVLIAQRLARRIGLPPDAVTLVLFVGTLGAFLGGRILWLAVNATRVASDPWLSATPRGGFVSVGGAAGLLATVWLVAPRFGLERARVGDLTAIAGLVALGCGRIGCLLTGCDHGEPVAPGPLALVFDHPEAAVPRELLGVPLAPVQPALALLDWTVAAVAAAILWRGARPGTALATALAGFGLGRFVIELWRGDADRGLWLDGHLSTGQLGALVALAAAAIVRWLSRRGTSG